MRQTHLSVVFLAGGFAYKLKKPVRFGFVDYGTLERRRHFCEEEVRLNRRLAPKVYLGVVPVGRGPAGGLRFEGEGEPVEWAVKMERLPEERTLRALLRGEEAGAAEVEALGRTVAAFHARAEAGPQVHAFGRFEVVARNALDNFAESAPRVGTTVHPVVFERFRGLTEGALARLEPLIRSRAERGVPRDTHGDLRLDHVYFLPGRPDPVVVDCIEFNEALRFADPVADASFLAMDLASEGRRDLAAPFVETYFAAREDEEGRVLLPLYVAYRAAVRGKVEGLGLAEKEIPGPQRVGALARSRAHWLLGLGVLEDPPRRPCLVLVGGLPGTGKSTVARALAERAGFEAIRTDVVRKELAGLAPDAPAWAAFGEGIYSTVWTERTYEECRLRAERLLFEGGRVVVDANFREERFRADFLDAAVRCGVPGVLLVCTAPAEEVRRRLATRRGDASDADWGIYLEAARRWEPPGTAALRSLREISTGGEGGAAVDQALEALRERGLLD